MRCVQTNTSINQLAPCTVGVLFFGSEDCTMPIFCHFVFPSLFWNVAYFCLILFFFRRSREEGTQREVWQHINPLDTLPGKQSGSGFVSNLSKGAGK
mmetsp:Transcript_18430/g.37286  ORF Transcript_18430/g.37286 Transcript_18430/m.37286 type:complete len:97 (-) Transcript_18430:97-387(-)